MRLVDDRRPCCARGCGRCRLARSRR